MEQPTKLRAALESISGAEDLAELALDMRWSWSHASDTLWGKIDPELWGITHNPWLVFQTASPAKLKQLLAEKNFRKEVDRLRAHQLSECDGTVGSDSASWFQAIHPGTKLRTVAYFSMEFGLSEALPIYSGGLGNVAGDQLKSASDLGVPVIGVGLLYQQGYFRQVIEADGSQRAVYPYNDPSQLPVLPLRDSTGEWLRIRIQLPGYAMWLMRPNSRANFAHCSICGDRRYSSSIYLWASGVSFRSSHATWRGEARAAVGAGIAGCGELERRDP
jgi:starch phosphorylase